MPEVPPQDPFEFMNEPGEIWAFGQRKPLLVQDGGIVFSPDSKFQVFHFERTNPNPRGNPMDPNAFEFEADETFANFVKEI